MSNKTTVLILLNSLYIFILTLFIFDYFTDVEINLSILKSVIYIGTLVGTFIIIIANLIFVEHKVWGKVSFVVPVCIALWIIYKNPLDLLLSSGVWHTQTILYENKQEKSIHIVHQIQNKGEFEYNNRIVEIQDFLPIFSFTKEVNLDKLKQEEWTEVNK